MRINPLRLSVTKKNQFSNLFRLKRRIVKCSLTARFPVVDLLVDARQRIKRGFAFKWMATDNFLGWKNDRNHFCSLELFTCISLK
jgi:hypothetical protein